MHISTSTFLSPAGAVGPGTGDIATPPSVCLSVLSPASAVGPGTGDIAMPPVRLSVRLSVCPSVRHV